ncbi:hypothetical protein DFH09DRAFT_433930 [Mycena vulgaris]|nr:hypothetical protein DFH09DRAFT_433930 [Mycena vulgaris]
MDGAHGAPRSASTDIALYAEALPSRPSTSHAKLPLRARNGENLTDPPSPSLEDRLEAFMDKLSMWQLVSNLDEGLLHRKDDRDWMQVFCEDVVEPRFGTTISAQTALLRSKIFPHSPFSDFSDSEEEGATSPDIPVDRARSMSVATADRGASASAAAAAPRKTLAEPARSRSRSLSITLAQEREREQRREGSVGAKRKVLNREVSMKRAFKPRERDPQAIEAERKEKERAEEKQKAEDARLAAIREKEKERQGTTLVAATPVKSQVRPRANTGRQRVEDERGSSPDILLMGT